MKKNMVSTSTDVQEAWKQLGVAVIDGNGQLRNSTDVFDDTVRALSTIENETERDTLAMTLFGKSADSLIRKLRWKVSCLRWTAPGITIPNGIREPLEMRMDEHLDIL